MTDSPTAITRLTLRNYKSIEACDIPLSRLTVLAGRNGAGKSNILDALCFVTDALRDTLEYAIRARGGIAQVRRKSQSKPTFPVIAVDLTLPDGSRAQYSFRIAAVRDSGFKVDREECVVSNTSGTRHSFATRDGQVADWTAKTAAPPVPSDRLYLVSVSGLPEFRGVFDVLVRMAFHNLYPDAMKLPQRPDPGALLSRDGSNLASVVKQLKTTHPERLDRVLEFIRAMGVPLKAVVYKQAGSLETLEISEDRDSERRDATFDAVALSDGTIRALGILVSLVSVTADGQSGPSLIGIEEPETALHPAASGALMEALLEGSERSQVLITCHSPDLLDHPDVTPDMIRPVVNEHGHTRTGRLDPAKARLLQDHLTTAGQLLRMDQLEPDPEDLKRQRDAKGTLFEGMA